MNDNSQIEINITLQKDLKRFFKTLLINLKSKNRAKDELKALQNHNRLLLGKEGIGITLIDKEYDQYRKIIKQLSEVFTKSKNYSKKYAETILIDAIWKVVESDKDINGAALEGSQHIKHKYTIGLSNWDIYFPVTGLLLHKRTEWNFGKAKFITIRNRKLLNSFKNRSFMPELGSVTCFIYIQVKAIDHSSAINIAKPIADLHISTINALGVISGISKHNTSLSSYGGIGEKIHSFTFVGKSRNLLGWSRSMSYNLAGFSPHVLKSNSFIKLFKPIKISTKLKIMQDKLYTDRIFPALKWTGRAISQNTEEEIFLYYCLAFEAILYENNFKEELMKNLKKRAYKLLFTHGSYLGNTIEALNEFDHLYKLRSAIVHRGGTEVSEDDIQLIKSLVVGCLYKFYQTKYYERFKTSKQLETWLDT
ncbi:hypothetical protein IPM65_02520 [Candidatus Roizmanbacteria bacterium]|nr:MAG: hypothetical protein IPM65_02520 [Candidatus Roizmanbacteria bacterium]